MMNNPFLKKCPLFVYHLNQVPTGLIHEIGCHTAHIVTIEREYRLKTIEPKKSGNQFILDSSDPG